ncbi:hypothetical protein BVRB_4g075100 [Beta vulgaris subsp. vulgaris]|nr:hypothetical protein BVRB_4g075100 [Beta vulgaris subsp. vulgaris]
MTSPSQSLDVPRNVEISFNLEVEEITLNNDYNMNEESQRITVKIPVEKSCGIQNANISSLDFGRSPYWFSEAENVFIVSGCGSTAVLRNRNNLSAAPTVLGWMVANSTGIAMPLSGDKKRHCQNYNYTAKVGEGIICFCESGYFGNPYIHDGCQALSECEGCKTGYCFGGPDSYHCSDYIAQYRWWWPLALIVLGFVVVLLLACSGNIYVCYRKRKFIKTKEKFFLQNGGLLMKQQLSLYGETESTKIFKAIKLKTATKNYNKNNILGKGGFGTVYKGVLSNEQVVAIKKSKITSESQSEVPLLVYEFVSNDNLYHHIHENGDTSWLSWENCLRIATEAANAIAYLHSAASIPIIHRDIKSSNILLDDNFVAKISDFGASRLVPIDQSQVTTLVQGTFGYLDPEYFQTNHLTEKSDVYSFGVVLLELLTRRKTTFVGKWG